MRNIQKKKIWQTGLCLLAFLSVTGLFNRIRNEVVVKPFLSQSEGHSDEIGFSSAEERKAGNQKYSTFCGLWTRRHEREVGAEMLPYLNDKVYGMRWRTIQALGRLEYVGAEASLQTLNKSNPAAKPVSDEAGIPALVGGKFYPVLPLAIGRIQAHDLKGKARVEKVCQSVGLSFAQVALLSQKLRKTGKRNVSGTPGEQVVKEIVDLLYTMRREGQEIDSFAGQMYLLPAQKVLLQGASLSIDEEIRLILDHASCIEFTSNSKRTLIVDHLLGLSPRAADAVFQKLSDTTKNRKNYSAACCSLLCQAAAAMNDPRAIPLLKELESDANPDVRLAAMRARNNLQYNPIFPLFPA